MLILIIMVKVMMIMKLTTIVTITMLRKIKFGNHDFPYVSLLFHNEDEGSDGRIQHQQPEPDVTFYNQTALVPSGCVSVREKHTGNANETFRPKRILE